MPTVFEEISERWDTGNDITRVADRSWATPMIHITNSMFCKHSGCINRGWLAIGILLFSGAASAATYPISGVWIAKDDRLPGSTAGACLLLKEFGVDVPSTQPFPRVMIFSGDQRFEMRGNFYAKSTIRSVEDVIGGGYKITETLDKRWFHFSKKPFFTLKIVGSTTIEVTEGNISTRLSKCSSNSPSL
jgi:hypothetical protein